jgi:hypothetical protein
MNGCLNLYPAPTTSVPPAIQPEQEDVHSESSDPPAEGDEDESSVISAPEATPIVTTTPPSNSGGSRKRGVATTARATSSAEVLCQLDGAQIPEGGWVGGDAWGSEA